MPARPSQSVRYIGSLVVVGLAASLLSAFFFCPRFVLWRGLSFPEPPFLNNPEVNRAIDVLKQLADPFAKIENPSNRVIQWRLLFPMIGHYLHLPLWLYMAIPQIGCVVVLAYVAHLVLREGGTWLAALFSAVLVGTGSWFFASTAWLTYADSWFLLGLLAVAFSPSRASLAVACLLEPFIDERFVLTLPLVYAIRVIYFRRLTRDHRRDLWRDTAVVAVLTVPYVALRIGLLMSSDVASAAYVQDRLKDLREEHASWDRYVDGVWMGMRAAWVLAIAPLWLLFRRRSVWQGALLGVATLLTMATGLTVAADIGRSMSAIIPAAVLGLLLLTRDRPTWIRHGLPALLALNLLLPASHVVTTFEEPIFYLHTELARYREPPAYFDAQSWVATAQQSMAQAKWDEALHQLDIAARLDARSTAAFLNRAVVYLRVQDLVRATRDAETALMLDPSLPDALFLRGIVYQRANDTMNATRLLQEALKDSPPDWSHRGECVAMLQQMSQ